jgi:MFS family permease
MQGYTHIYFAPIMDALQLSKTVPSQKNSKLDLLPGLFPERFQELEMPFYITSVVTATLLVLCALVCSLSVSLYVFGQLYERHRGERADLFDKCRTLLSLSTLLSSAAAVIYLLSTSRLLEGGRYLAGMWLTLAASVLGIVGSVYFSSFDEDDSRQPLQQRYAYEPIPDDRETNGSV